MRARPEKVLSVVVHRESGVISYFAEVFWFDAEGNAKVETWEADYLRSGFAMTVLKKNAVAYNLVLFPTLEEGGALEVTVKADEEECRETITVSAPISWTVHLT